jgi:hypothetical protein
MALDKLGLVTEIILNMANSATADELLDDMEKTFDIVEQIESMAISRGWFFPEECPKCGGKINIIEMNSMTNRMYRIHCDCSDGTGQSKNEAITKWINQ